MVTLLEDIKNAINEVTEESRDVNELINER